MVSSFLKTRVTDVAKCSKSLTIFGGLIKYFWIYLGQLFWNCANVHCCKRPNIEKNIYPSGHTAQDQTATVQMPFDNDTFSATKSYIVWYISKFLSHDKNP